MSLKELQDGASFERRLRILEDTLVRAAGLSGSRGHVHKGADDGEPSTLKQQQEPEIQGAREERQQQTQCRE